MPEYDVSAIAKVFGGGGHKVAAGTIVKADSIQDVVTKIIDTANSLKK